MAPMIALSARTIGTKAAMAERDAINRMKKVTSSVGGSSESSELLTYLPKSPLISVLSRTETVRLG